nr:MAG TPA: hypothetical protein [Caudoviricetes sp.]
MGGDLSLARSQGRSAPRRVSPSCQGSGPPGVNAGAPARTRATAGWHKLS